MPTVGDRIKALRKKLGISQVDFADKIGVSKQTLYKYENNIITNIPSDKIEAIAVNFKISPSSLMGWDEEQKIADQATTKAVRIPVLGRVAAGLPLFADEEIIDYEDISDAMAKDGEYYGLRIRGDSMEPKFSDGDVVIVRKQEDADNGDIVIALVNGNDAVCKRLRKYSDGAVALVSTNPAYEPIYFSGEEVAGTPVRIIGKVKELRAKF